MHLAQIRRFWILQIYVCILKWSCWSLSCGAYCRRHKTSGPVRSWGPKGTQTFSLTYRNSTMVSTWWTILAYICCSILHKYSSTSGWIRKGRAGRTVGDRVNNMVAFIERNPGCRTPHLNLNPRAKRKVGWNNHCCLLPNGGRRDFPPAATSLSLWHIEVCLACYELTSSTSLRPLRKCDLHMPQTLCLPPACLTTQPFIQSRFNLRTPPLKALIWRCSIWCTNNETHCPLAICQNRNCTNKLMEGTCFKWMNVVWEICKW